jgi:hypothetical protein
VLVWELAGTSVARSAVADGALVVGFADGAADEHRFADDASRSADVGGAADRAWHVRRTAADGRADALTLAVGAPPAVPVDTPPDDAEPDEPDHAAAPEEVALAADGAMFVRTLAAPDYLRSEESWDEAGRPTAHVTLAVRDDRLHFDVAVRLGRAPVFVPLDAENPLDNERAAINGDGVQVHLGLEAGDAVEPVGAWLLVPVPPGDAVAVARTTRPDATADAAAPTARWAAAPGGWTLAGALALAPLRARAAALGVAPVLAFALLVNEMPAGRERRRGQLVLGGARGRGAATFVYLRGDRHDPARGVRLRLPPEPRPPR